MIIVLSLEKKKQAAQKAIAFEKTLKHRKRSDLLDMAYS